MLVVARYISFCLKLLVLTSCSSTAALHCVANSYAPEIQAEDCRQLVSRIPSLYFDPTVQLQREDLFFSLRLPEEGYRNPAFFTYGTCSLRITALPAIGPGAVREEHLALFIWRDARKVARVVIEACVEPHRQIGWNWDFPRVPGQGEVPFNVWVVAPDSHLQYGCTLYDLVGRAVVNDAIEPESDRG